MNNRYATCCIETVLVGNIESKVVEQAVQSLYRLLQKISELYVMLPYRIVGSDFNNRLFKFYGNSIE